jgi:Fe-S-cluster containining protein
MGNTLRSILPMVYDARLPDMFDHPLVEEPRATCSDCAMCDKGAAPKSNVRAGFFHPEIKCCTYHPTLPNYLVGAALADTSPDFAEGRERLRAKLAQRIGVTPGWLGAPKKQHVLFQAARESSFGRAESLVCPYYIREGGKCGIWRFRESVCATFFCKHAAGKTSHEFWTAYKMVLIHIERALSRYALKSVDPEVVEPSLPLNKLTLEDLEDRPPLEESYASWWRAWVGREEEFYRACARAVEGLTKEAVFALIDDEEGRTRLAAMKEAYQAVTRPRLADKLTLEPNMTVVATDGGVVATAYSRYDPLFLTEDLYLALQEFSANETVHEVLARLVREHEVELPESLLLSMQMVGVMTRPQPREP